MAVDKDTERRRDYDTQWHLDKRIPVALLLMIVVQTGGAFWWAGRIENRIDTIEKTQNTRANVSDRLTRLEVLIERMESVLTKLERKLDFPRK